MKCGHDDCFTCPYLDCILDDNKRPKKIPPKVKGRKRTEEEKKAIHQKWVDEHKEYLREYHREYKRKHKEEVRENQRNFIHKHREEHNARGRKYYQEHKEELREKRRLKREAKKLEQQML